jgi:hypothetical protein
VLAVDKPNFLVNQINCWKDNRVTPSGSPTRKVNYRTVERELWMLSGNECAYEGCTERMVTESGAYVGQIAHIRGVGRTSARHDPSMSDDELRDKSNLILLCYRHHVETDDEAQYPVERMRKMKERHESRFKRAYAEFEVQFKDYTDELHATHCRTLTRWLDVLDLHGDDFDQDYVRTEIRDLNKLADGLSDLTDEARRLVSFVVARGSENTVECAFHFPLDELARRTKTSKSRIVTIFNELERLDFGRVSDSDYGEPPEVIVYAPTSDPRFRSELLGSLRTYCEQSKNELDDLIVSLRFDLLDT